MTYFICLIFVVSIIFMCVYQMQRISANEQIGDSKKLFSTLSINDFKIHNRKVDDCNLERQYCYNDHDCFNRCQLSDKGIFHCKSGTCKLSVNQKKLNLGPDCDLKKGMAPFLVGIPELGTVEAICKPVDLGIVYIDERTNKIENKMCCGNNDDIDYSRVWPDPANCKCEEDGDLPIIIPATENVRQYVHCIKADDVRKWIYAETKLIYGKTNSDDDL